ncbi:MAG: antibiotic biosynthesis monooxygenase [Thermodesulfobacteriota bacterium]
MPLIGNTPKPPYYAVIFTSVRTEANDGYGDMADRMLDLAKNQPGFLGVESAREQTGITVSYWIDLAAIQKWKDHPEHRKAQALGRQKWYAAFKVRVVRVEKEYGHPHG